MYTMHSLSKSYGGTRVHLGRQRFPSSLNVTQSACLSRIKVHSHSVDPQENHRNYLITYSILKCPTPRRSLSQRCSSDIYISTVGSKNKKLAVLPVLYCTVAVLP